MTISSKLNKNEVIISKEEHEFLLKCKEGNISKVFAPQSYTEGTAVYVADTKEDILSQTMEMISQPAPSTSDMNNDIANIIMLLTSDGLANKFGESESLAILKTMEQHKDIMTANGLITLESNNILSQVEDFDIALIEPFELKREIFIRYQREYTRLSNTLFKKIKNKKNFVNEFNKLQDVGKNVRNSICDIISSIKKLDPTIKEREVFRYLNQDFCPESYDEYQKETQQKGWFLGLKEKVKNIVSLVTQNRVTNAFFSLRKNRFIKKMTSYSNLLMKHYVTLYVIYVVVGNIGVQVGVKIITGQLGFMDIILALATAGCKSLSNPFILGKIVRFFTENIFRTYSFNLLGDRVYKGTGVILGNSIAYLSALFLNTWVRNMLEWCIHLVCDVISKIGILTYLIGKTSGHLAYGLYISIEKSDGFPLAGLQMWWKHLSATSKDDVGRIFIELGGSQLKQIFLMITNPVGTAYTQTKETINFAFNYTGNKISSILYGTQDNLQEKSIEEIAQDVTLSYKNIKDIIIKIKDIIANYGSECTDYLSNYLSPIVTRFNEIYQTCFDSFQAFLDMLSHIYSLYAFIYNSYMDMKETYPSDEIISDLEKEILMLRKDNQNKIRLIKLQSNFIKESLEEEDTKKRKKR